MATKIYYILFLAQNGLFPPTPHESHAEFQLLQQGSGEGGKLGGGCPRALTYSAFHLSAEVPPKKS